MLDNLRAMAVFANVVQHSSFSGSAKELGITTSAVSQQIRALETDLGVVLLHRSTRKLSLTEAGASLYESAKNMVKAAEEGRNIVGQLRDGLQGNLRIATTPELAKNHVLPALKIWLDRHADLTVQLTTSHLAVDMIDERVDLAVYFSPTNKDLGVPLLKADYWLLASQEYLQKHAPMTTLEQLTAHEFITSEDNKEIVALAADGTKQTIRPVVRIVCYDVSLMIELAQKGFGVVKVNSLDAWQYVQSGKLVQILPEYDFGKTILYAKTQSKDQQPAKVWRCLEVLTDYFANKAF